MNDLISRQAVIDAVCKVGCESGYCGIPCDDVKAIEQLPSAQTWIPCTERLPESKKSVFISTKDWTGEGCYYGTIENHVMWKGYRWGAIYWDDEVTAWMPLPEVYKEEE